MANGFFLGGSSVRTISRTYRQLGNIIKKLLFPIIIVIIIAGGIGIFYVFQNYIFFKPLSLSEERLPFLKTAGQDIIDENGKKVFLKGVNFGNWLLWETCSLLTLDCAGYPESLLRQELEKRMPKEKVDLLFNKIVENLIQESDFKKVKDLGFNFVRLNFHYRYVQPDQLTKLDEAVGWAKQNGVYVILNMHAAPGAQASAYFADTTGPAHLWDTPSYQEEYFKLWKILAERYKNEPTVAGYEILNEPVAVNGRQVTELYQQAIGYIRQIDNRHIIFLDGNNYASDFSIFPQPLAENTVYVFHNYDVSLANLEETIAAKKYFDFRNKYQVPLMCNEFGEPVFADYFTSQNISWAPWSFKGRQNQWLYYALPKDNQWQMLLDNVDNLSAPDNTQVMVGAGEIINSSTLSRIAKSGILEIIETNKLSELKSPISLQKKFPNDSQELERVFGELRNLFTDYVNSFDAAWLDNFADSLNAMSDKEMNSLTEALQTRYWSFKGK